MGEGSSVSRSYKTTKVHVGVGFFLGLVLLNLLVGVRAGRDAPDPLDTESTMLQLHQKLKIDELSAPFSIGSPGAWFLQTGFHHPDSQGALMSEDFAVLRFDADDSEPVSATILLSAIPFDGSPTIRVALESSIDEVTLEVAGLKLMTVALDGEPVQEIFLRCKVPPSPFALDQGPDLRASCLRVLEMFISVESS